MNLIKQLQLWFHHYFLRKRLKKSPIQRASTSFRKSRRIGILYDASDPENERIVSKYAKKLSKLGKDIQILAYFDDKQPRENHIHKHFNKKNLNWYLKPTGMEIERFIDGEYDILIGLHLTSILPLEYIAAVSDAQVRVGQHRNNNEHCYDLMIQMDEKNDMDLQNFIGQIDFFLKTIQ